MTRPAPGDDRADGAGDAVVEEILARARGEHEAAVARVRLLLCGLVFLRILVLYGRDLLALAAKPWVATAGLAAGAAFSWLTLRRLRRGGPLRLRLSVVVDAVIVTWVLATAAVWPHAGYVGILREHDVAVYLILVVAAGARLAPNAAALGAAANALGLGALVALDHALLGQRLGYPPGDVGLAVVLLLGATALGGAFSRGARRLVEEAAAAARLAARARDRLGVYVSPDVASEALESGVLELGGARREAAVLFSDLRGFTRYSEHRPPEAIVGELNAYLEDVVAALHAEGGVVDKFLGDGIMAVFGVPTRRGDPAAAALRAAAGMAAALASHNAARAARGLEPLAQGIGLHAGHVVAGNVGTAERMQYTCMGDVVNLASRLEAATKELGAPVIASGALVALARASGEPLPPLRPAGTVTVRGRDAAVEVFAVGDAVPAGQAQAPPPAAGAPAGAA